MRQAAARPARPQAQRAGLASASLQDRGISGTEPGAVVGGVVGALGGKDLAKPVAKGAKELGKQARKAWRRLS